MKIIVLLLATFFVVPPFLYAAECAPVQFVPNTVSVIVHQTETVSLFTRLSPILVDALPDLACARIGTENGVVALNEHFKTIVPNAWLLDTPQDVQAFELLDECARTKNKGGTDPLVHLMHQLTKYVGVQSNYVKQLAYVYVFALSRGRKDTIGMEYEEFKDVQAAFNAAENYPTNRPVAQVFNLLYAECLWNEQQKKIVCLDENVCTLQKKWDESQHDCQTHQEELLKIRKEKQQLKIKLQQSNLPPENLDIKIKKIELQNKRCVAAKNRQNLGQKNKELQTGLDDLNKKLADKTQKINELGKDIAEIQKSMQADVNQTTELHTRVDTLNKQLQEKEQQVQAQQPRVRTRIIDTFSVRMQVGCLLLFIGAFLAGIFFEKVAVISDVVDKITAGVHAV